MSRVLTVLSFLMLIVVLCQMFLLLGIKEYEVSDTHTVLEKLYVYMYIYTNINILYYLYNMVIFTHTKREEKNNKTNKNWGTWAKTQ